MIQRRRRQVDHALAVLPEFLQEVEDRQLLGRRVLRQRPQNALRPAGGTGRIKHRGADAFVRYWRPGPPARRLPLIDDAVAFTGAIDDDAELDPGAFLERLARDGEL